jgi:farnesyl-diphosphate farnesyltransferase
MLTDLVVAAEPSLEPVRERLDADAIAFGEALQLTNILKDSGDDKKQGRTYVPPTVDRIEVFALAEDDLDRARRYTRVLAKNWASRGTIAFHALPVRLAAATLEIVKKDGPGAKIPRETVAAHVSAMNLDLDRGGDGLG